MKAKKKQISNRDLDFMIAEAIWHGQLDALGCPAGNTIGLRLTAWCKAKGIDPFGGGTNLRVCHQCQTEYLKGAMCPKCYAQ